MFSLHVTQRTFSIFIAFYIVHKYLQYCLMHYRCLVKLMGEHGSGDWDQYLEPTLFGIRTSVQESTKHTPFFLMHGREAIEFPLRLSRLYQSQVQVS